jgi:hypothetical protein
MVNKKELIDAITKAKQADIQYFNLDWLNNPDAQSKMRLLNQQLKQGAWSLIALKK